MLLTIAVCNHGNSIGMALKTPLKELDISNKLSNVCEAARIKTLEELFKLDYTALLRIRGLGKKTLEEINTLRIKYGIQPLEYSAKTDPSKVIAHRENVFYNIDDLSSIPYNILINIRITEFNLTNRLVNSLMSLKVKKIKDIINANITPEKLRYKRNVGIKTLKEYECFYFALEERIQQRKTNSSDKDRASDLLQDKQLADIVISFPLYDALNKLGVNKLKDILDLNITAQKLYNQIGLRAKTADEFSLLLDNLKKENAQSKLIPPEPFPKSATYFDVSGLPENFRQLPVKFFMLPPVVDRFLENNQIHIFKELDTMPYNQLIGLTPFITQTLRALIQNFAEGTFYKDFVPREPYYFPCWVDSFIDRLKGRDTEIFKLRYGFYEEIYTLEEIGRKVELTRERTRQILNNITRDFIRKFGLPLKNLEIEFREIIISNFGPLTDKEIFKKMDEDGLIVPKYPRQMYLYFLHEVSPQMLIELTGKILKTKFSSHEERVELRIIKLLKERFPISISKLKFRQFIQENSKIDIFSFVRVALMSNRIIIEEQNDKIKLALKRSTFDNGVRAIFNSVENPITISEFKKKLHFHFPNLKNFSEEDYIRARLVNHPEVYRLDTDLFGNVKHLRTLCPNKDKIIEFCYHEFENRRIPTAVYDLVELIPSSDIRFVPQNPNFLLDAVISTDKRFIKLGRLLYGLKKWGKIELLNVADQAFEILRGNKAPMHFNELFNVLRQSRSVHEISLNTILRIDERFHNYSPGWYGLSDTHEENLIYLLLHSPYIDSLIYSQQPETSLEEIVDALDMQDYFDIEELAVVLIKDQRFIIYERDGKKRVFHKNWFTRKLIAKILRNRKKGLNIQELQWELNDLYGFDRKFSLKDIRHALSTMTNIAKVENRFVLTKEIEISDNFQEKINTFVKVNMPDMKTLYNLEEMFDLFMDVTEIDEEEITYHHFKIAFEKEFKICFVPIGSDIYRRTS